MDLEALNMWVLQEVIPCNGLIYKKNARFIVSNKANGYFFNFG